MKNNYEGVHFSKVAGLLAITLLKMNSFTDTFQLFNNTYTNIYFAEQVSLDTPESMSHRSIKNPFCVTFLVSITDTCFFLTVALFSLKKFSIKEIRKENTGFLVLKKDSRKKKSIYRISYFIIGRDGVIYASTCGF